MGICGIFFIRGNARFVSSTAVVRATLLSREYVPKMFPGEA